MSSFGLTAAAAIAISLLVSFTLTPMLAARWIRPLEEPAGASASGQDARHGSKQSRFYQPVDRAYTRMLEWSMAHRAIIADPYYAEAFACLSLMYTNSIRFGYKGFATSLNPLRRAMALAQRAIQLSPRSSRAYLALATAYWFNGQVDSAFEALRTSHALNPNDLEVLAELGLRHALCGNWDEGVARINEAYRRVGLKAAVVFADQLMYTGYRYATRAGVSFCADDMMIPEKKVELLADAEAAVLEIQPEPHDRTLADHDRPVATKPCRDT